MCLIISFFWVLIYNLSVTSSYDVTPSLFSQTRPKISDSLVIRASPSHWKEGERPARARVTFTWISPHLPSLSGGELQKKGQMARPRPPTLTFSPNSLLFLSSNHLRPLSSPFEIFPLLYPHVLHPPPPILLGVHSCASCSPDQKKRGRREESWRRDPWDVICPRGMVVKNNNWEQGEKSQMSRFFWNVPCRVESTDTLPEGCNLFYSWFHWKPSTKHRPIVIFFLETIKLFRKDIVAIIILLILQYKLQNLNRYRSS